MFPLSIKFSKAANSLDIVTWYFFLIFTSFYFHRSDQPWRRSFNYWQSLPNFCNHQAAISITVSCTYSTLERHLLWICLWFFPTGGSRFIDDRFDGGSLWSWQLGLLTWQSLQFSHYYLCYVFAQRVSSPFADTRLSSPLSLALL